MFRLSIARQEENLASIADAHSRLDAHVELKRDALALDECNQPVKCSTHVAFHAGRFGKLLAIGLRRIEQIGRPEANQYAAVRCRGVIISESAEPWPEKKTRHSGNQWQQLQLHCQLILTHQPRFLDHSMGDSSKRVDVKPSHSPTRLLANSLKAYRIGHYGSVGRITELNVARIVEGAQKPPLARSLLQIDRDGLRGVLRDNAERCIGG
jgi:hypothetical protein